MFSFEGRHLVACSYNMFMIMLNFFLLLSAVCDPPCKNGGECIIESNVCNCTRLFTGYRCQKGKEIKHSNSYRCPLPAEHLSVLLFVTGIAIISFVRKIIIYGH
jgi:hypothetical protein